MTDQERQKAEELISRLELSVGQIFPRDGGNAALLTAMIHSLNGLRSLLMTIDDSLLDRPKRPQLKPAEPCHRVLGRDLDRLVQALTIEDVEAGDPLAGFGERAISDQQLAGAYPHGCRVFNRT